VHVRARRRAVGVFRGLHVRKAGCRERALAGVDAARKAAEVRALRSSIPITCSKIVCPERLSRISMVGGPNVVSLYFSPLIVKPLPKPPPPATLSASEESTTA